MSNTIPWLRVIDDELICSHLGVANEDDNYATAKRKLETLIAWHVAVATDPQVNGGYELVPSKISTEMALAFWGEYDSSESRSLTRAYKKMLDEAPKDGPLKDAYEPWTKFKEKLFD